MAYSHKYALGTTTLIEHKDSQAALYKERTQQAQSVNTYAASKKDAMESRDFESAKYFKKAQSEAEKMVKAATIWIEYLEGKPDSIPPKHWPDTLEYELNYIEGIILYPE